MISKGSCVTEDWNNDWWNFSFAITVTNYILKIKLIFVDINAVIYSQTETELLALCIFLQSMHTYTDI